MLVWAVSACAGGADSTRPAAGSVATPAAASKDRASTVNASRQAITQAIQLGCSEHAHCASIGIGARACGGPEQFMAYSVRDTSATALQQASQRYAQLRKKQLEERGEMSTCDLLPDPGAQCSAAGQCQLIPAGDGRGRGAPGGPAR